MKQIFLSVLFLMLLAGSAEAVTRYVDSTLAADCTSGNYSITNRNCTGSDGNAWNTLAEGITSTASNDTLIVRGTFNEGITVDQLNGKGGTGGNRTKIIGLNGVKWTLAPNPCPTNSRIISLLNDSWFEFGDFILDAGPGSCKMGVKLNDATQDNVFRHFEIKNQFLAGTDSSNTAFSFDAGVPLSHRNRISHCWIHYPTMGTNTQSHGIYVTGTDNVVEYCTVENSPGHGLHVWNATAGTNARTILRYNIVRNSNSRCTILTNAPDSEFYGNLCIGMNADTAILAPATGIKVYNNVVYGAVFTEDCIQATASGVTVRNNVCLDNTGAGGNTITVSGGAVASNNVSTTDETIVVDAANDRFSPREGSALIDGGSSTGIPAGLGWIGGAPDVGALESPVFVNGTVENGDAGTARYNFLLATQSIRNGVGLSTCNQGNYAVILDGTGAAELGCSFTQTNRVNVTISPSVSGSGVVVQGGYTRSGTLANNLTDNVCIGGEVGGCKNAEVRNITTITFTNNVAGAGTAVLNTVNYRWFHLEGTIASPKYRGVENSTTGSVMKGGHTAMVFGIENITAAWGSAGFEIHYNRNGGAYSKLTDVCSVTAPCFGIAGGTTLVDNENITAALTTNPHGTFLTGKVLGKELTNPVVNFIQNSMTNQLGLLKFDATTAVGDTFCFQPRLIGGTNFTQTQTPCLTVVNPSMAE